MKVKESMTELIVRDLRRVKQEETINVCPKREVQVVVEHLFQDTFRGWN